MVERELLIICILIVMIPTVYLFIILNGLDKFILGFSVIVQIITLLGVLVKKKPISEIGHIIFGFILFIIPIFGQSIYILILVAFVLLLTLITRKLFNNCIFHYDIENKKIFDLIPNFNWDLTYLILLIVVIFRVILLSKILF